MTLLPLHIVAGSIALIAGAVALYAAKGGKIHRQSGMAFLWTVSVMTMSAIVIGLLDGHRVNTSQGALTCYLVVTAYFAVKLRAGQPRWPIIGGMLLAIGIGAYDVKLGLEALAHPNRIVEKVPAVMMFIFGGIALLGALGDLRLLRSTNVPARQRVGRHLWRMGVALWIATASFFLGQANFIPEPLRILPLLALPVLLVFGATIYWLVRVSIMGKPWASLSARRPANVA